MRGPSMYNETLIITLELNNKTIFYFIHLPNNFKYISQAVGFAYTFEKIQSFHAYVRHSTFNIKRITYYI